jgi:hypothetical protein
MGEKLEGKKKLAQHPRAESVPGNPAFSRAVGNAALVPPMPEDGMP